MKATVIQPKGSGEVSQEERVTSHAGPPLEQTDAEILSGYTDEAHRHLRAGNLSLFRLGRVLCQAEEALKHGEALAEAGETSLRVLPAFLMHRGVAASSGPLRSGEAATRPLELGIPSQPLLNVGQSPRIGPTHRRSNPHRCLLVARPFSQFEHTLRPSPSSTQSLQQLLTINMYIKLRTMVSAHVG